MGLFFLLLDIHPSPLPVRLDAKGPCIIGFLRLGILSMPRGYAP
jgi:hypothetical protein